MSTDYGFKSIDDYYDPEKWIVIDDIKLIKQLATITNYQRVNGVKKKIKTYVYGQDVLNKIKQGLVVFLCSINNVYLNVNHYKEEMKTILASLKKDKAMVLDVHKTLFPNHAEGEKRKLNDFQEIPYLKIKSTVDKYLKDLKDQF